MHEIASEHGEELDHMLALVHWFMLILAVGWGIFMIYVLIRFNARRNKKASYSGITNHFSTHVEMGVVIVEVVLLLGFAFPLWAARVEKFPDSPDVVKVRAVGQQFLWTFHYAGKDGMMGQVDLDEINAGGNPVGLVREPNALDDFAVPNTLKLPKGRRVIVQVTSKDVIHGLALVPMMIQQDAIPGQEVPMWFTPTKTGEWDIVCAQLCGASHGQMKATLEVVEPEEYDAWVESQPPMLKPEAPEKTAGAASPESSKGAVASN